MLEARKAVQVAEIDRQLLAVTSQTRRLEARLTRLQDRMEQAERQRNKLRAKRQRLRLCRMIGKPVKQVAQWGRTPHKTDSLIGTLLSVNRRWAVVDYGAAGQWRVPVDWLQVADAERIDGGAVMFP